MLKIIEFKDLNSTNDFALKYTKENQESDEILIVSEIQTKGRGRKNERVWVSCQGNFHGSYIFDLEKLSIKSNEVSTINSLVLKALYDFFLYIVQKTKKLVEIKIKYPNDIFVNNKKISGVLTEVFFPHVIIGVGVNLQISPIETSTNIFSEFGFLLTITDFGTQFYNFLKHRLKND